MEQKHKSRLFVYLKIAGINIFIFFALVFSLEALSRTLFKVTYFGSSKTLFIRSDVGQIKNCKSCTAKSFGVDVFTDKNGLRVKKNYMVDDNLDKDKMIILGDSIGFGPGVDFSSTFPDRLSKSFPNYKFENHSVIGHTIDDHLITANQILSTEDESKIKNTFLIYCFNDISSISSSEIREKLSNEAATEIHNDLGLGWIKNLRSNSIAKKINVYLRDKSSLYLLIKGISTSPSKRYFYNDTKPYHQRITSIEEALQPLLIISKTFRSKGIPFTVIISPYEYQLREEAKRKDNNLFLPQKIVSTYLEKNKINYVDATSAFLQYPHDSSDLFLAYDAVHLSAKGHLILHDIIVNIIK